MTKLINLYGGPCAGKSTAAAWLFAKMKMRGLNVELVTEAAKDLVWEENRCRLDNQLHVLGEQSTRLLRLKDKVDYIVTDSPMLMQEYYGNGLPVDPLFRLIWSVEEEFDCYDIWISRAGEFSPVGRTQACPQEADKAAYHIKTSVEDSLSVMSSRSIELCILGNKQGYKRLWKFVKERVLNVGEENHCSA